MIYVTELILGFSIFVKCVSKFVIIVIEGLFIQWFLMMSFFSLSLLLLALSLSLSLSLFLFLFLLLQSYREFDDMYRARLGNLSYQFEATCAFDALWSLALALHNVSMSVCMGDDLGCNETQVTNLTALENYTYYNDKVECMLMKNLSGQEFLGVSVS